MEKKKGKKRTKKTAEKKAPAESLQFELEELHKYKLLALSAKLEKLREKVRQPIWEKKNREFIDEFQSALKEDSDYLVAVKEQQEAINEVLRSAAELLPEGYAVVRIDPETGQYEAKYSPEMANQLLKG